MGLAIQERRYLAETPVREQSLAWIISVVLHLSVIALVWLFPNPSVIAPALLSKEVFLMRADPQLAMTTTDKAEQIRPITTEATTPKAQPKQSITPPIKQPDVSISTPPPKKKPEPPSKQQELTAPPEKTVNVKSSKPIESIKTDSPKTEDTNDSEPAEADPRPNPQSGRSVPTSPVYTQARIDAKYARDNPQPQYPPMARRLGQEGTVRLKVTVNSEGYAEDVRIEQSSGYPLLDKAAVQAISKWRFVPATRDGQAITQALKTQWVYKLTDR